mgnify:CR=1 FL=1
MRIPSNKLISLHTDKWIDYSMTTKTKIILYTSLLFNLSALIYFAPKIYRKLNDRSNTASDNQSTYSMKRDKYYEVLSPDSNAIVFLGTSLTQNFEIHEAFKNEHTQNRGINGDWTRGMRNRLNPIIQEQPKKIFIETGINDIGDRNLSKEAILSEFRLLINDIQENSEETQIYVNSILPVSNKNQGMVGYSGTKINETIVELNSQIQNLSEQLGFTFIDTHSFFAQNGEIRPQFTIDGVHLSGEGYIRWAEILTPYVNEF